MNLTVSPLAPPALIVTIASVLAVVLFVREIRSTQRFPAVRIPAQALALTALLGIAFRPSVDHETEIRSVMLLTPSYDATIADSIAAANPNIQILISPGAAAFPNSKTLERWDHIPRWEREISVVVGNGIPVFALDLIEKPAFQFFPSRHQAGITVLSGGPFYPHRQNILHGEILTEGKTSILLDGPGGKEDSVQIEGPGLSGFELSFVPKQPGNLLYHLTIAGKERKTEILPVNVLNEVKLSFLFLLQAPDPETRYLKNFLSDRGHAVAVRHQVSQHVYRYEYINRAPGAKDLNDPAALEQIDLLIADAASLNQMTRPERNTLENQVGQGLGIILLSSAGGKSPEFIPVPNIIPLKEGKDTLQILAGKERLLVTASGTGRQSDTGFRPVIVTPDGRWTSAWKSRGAGTIGIQLLKNTWPLILKEKVNSYSAIWTPLIEAAARRRTSQFKLAVSPPFPVFANDPSTVEIISAGRVPELLLDGERIPVRENAVWDDLWHSKFWVMAGWHELMIRQDSSRLNFYAFSKGAWSGLSAANQITLNKSLAEKKGDVHQITTTGKEIPAILFLIVFVLASAALWLIPKL